MLALLPLMVMLLLLLLPELSVAAVQKYTVPVRVRGGCWAVLLLIMMVWQR